MDEHDPNEVDQQSGEVVEPLETAERVEDFFDEDGQIKGSPANDLPDETEDEDDESESTEASAEVEAE